MVLVLNPVAIANVETGIRRAILEGDIDKALKLTNTFYPHVLKENHDVYFRLRCRKFIEMVRKGAELNQGASRRSNGHSSDDDVTNEMDVDENGENGESGENGYADRMETEDGGLGPDSTVSNQDNLLLETIQYGQQLQVEFKDDRRKEIAKSLQDVFALLAYSNPLEVKEVSHLLDRKGRVAVAEELNSAILGKLFLYNLPPPSLYIYIMRATPVANGSFSVNQKRR